MATSASKKMPVSQAETPRLENIGSVAANGKTKRILKSPPKPGTLSRAAVRKAVADAIMAHKK